MSSPGAERPLRSLEHFATYAGEQVKIKLSELHQGRKRIKGLLKGVDEDKILVSVDDKEYAIPHRIIIKAHLAPDYSFK